MGTIYVQIGKFEEAKKSFFKAININSHFTKSHREVSRIIKYTSQEKHLNELIKVYSQIKIKDVENKSNIAFELGKAYEDISDFDKSFHYYKEANTLYQKKINASIESKKDYFLNIKKTFNKKIYEKYSKLGSYDSSAIFILGMPRSGTTLIEQILSNHSKVFGAGLKSLRNRKEQLSHTYIIQKIDLRIL